MKSYTMSRTIPLDDSWDVIVAGGGPAGCAAAAAAARDGARTLLVEATGCLGGMGTAGLVTSWCPFTDGVRLIYSGLANEVFAKSREGIAHVASDELHGHKPFDPEQLKRVYDDLVMAHGVRVLFQSRLVGVDTEKGAVSAVFVGNKAGTTAYRARVYIDCTGDADLAAWAGADYEVGTPETGEVMPASYCFVMSNVDSYAFAHGPGLFTGSPESPMWDIHRSGRYDAIYDAGLCPSLIGPDTVGFNTGHQPNLDSTDPEAVSEAFIRGRRAAAQYREALAEYYSTAFANAHLAETAPLVGIRESRRVVGDYWFTEADYQARRSFDDEICRNCYHTDMHSNRENEERSYEQWRERTGKNTHYDQGESHGIPYRCLTPKGLENVLVAGRPISADRVAHASVRVMPVCLATGEAAGTAAARAAAACGGNVHDVDVTTLRQRLRDQGAYLP